MYIIASPIKTIYKIVTTQKTIIIDNKIILPSKPDGDLMFNMMIVYDSNNTVTEFDDVTITTDINNVSYAVLNESDTINGFGVVSYIINEEVII
jgi:hypothetical protein